MVAVFPARARSRMSARPRGRSRTRSPCAISTGPTWTHSSAAVVRLGIPAIHETPPPGRGRRPRTVPCSPSNCSRAIASVRASRSPHAVVDRGHRALLVVGQRHDPQRQHLVDLGAVEEVAGALRGDLRIVVEDDRRRRASCRARPSSPTRTGQVPTLRHAGGGLAPAVGRIEQRDELAVADAEDRVRRDQGAEQGLVAGRGLRARPGACRFDDAQRQPEQPVGGLDRADLDDPLDCLLLAHQDADDRAVRPAHRLPPPPAREREPDGSRAGHEVARASSRRSAPRAPRPPARCGESGRPTRSVSTGRKGGSRRPCPSRRGAGRARRPGGPSGAGSGRPPRTSLPTSPCDQAFRLVGSRRRRRPGPGSRPRDKGRRRSSAGGS